RAVANRPVEKFDTEVTLPEWEIDNEAGYLGEPDNGVFVDEDGNPIDPGASARDNPGGDDSVLDQDWIDRMTGRATRDDAPPPPPPGPSDIPRPPAQQFDRPLRESGGGTRRGEDPGRRRDEDLRRQE